MVLAVVGAIALSSFFTGGQEYTKVDPSAARGELSSGNVVKAVLEDREQNLVLDLKTKIDVKGVQTTHINAQVPAASGNSVWAECNTLEASGKLPVFDTKVTK